MSPDRLTSVPEGVFNASLMDIISADLDANFRYPQLLVAKHFGTRTAFFKKSLAGEISWEQYSNFNFYQLKPNHILDSVNRSHTAYELPSISSDKLVDLWGKAVGDLGYFVFNGLLNIPMSSVLYGSSVDQFLSAGDNKPIINTVYNIFSAGDEALHSPYLLKIATEYRDSLRGFRKKKSEIHNFPIEQQYQLESYWEEIQLKISKAITPILKNVNSKSKTPLSRIKMELVFQNTFESSKSYAVLPKDE